MLIRYQKQLFWIAFILCVCAGLVPLWSVKYLPMADLPQHAAQLSILRHLNNPDFYFFHQFEIHWFTPYLVGTLLPLPLAAAWGELIALKIILSLVVIALPLSLYVLFREVDVDPWWSLFGVVLFYGFSFYWGFFSYLVALPVGFVFVWTTVRFGQDQSAFGLTVIACIALITFFSHALVFFFCGVLIILLSILREESWKNSLRIYSVVFLPAFFLFLIMAYQTAQDVRAHEVPEWMYSAGRLIRGPFLLMGGVGVPFEKEASVVLLGVVALGFGRPRSAKSFLLILFMLALYLLLPHAVFGVYMVYQRVALFVLVALLLSWPKTPILWRWGLQRCLIVVMTVGWMGVITKEFKRFDKQCQGFDVVKELIPDRSCLLGAISMQVGDHATHPFGHFPAWIQAEKGGVINFSFGLYYNMVARYKKDAEIIEMYKAHTFYYNPYDARLARYPFTHILVRDPRDRQADLEKSLNTPIESLGREGDWWVYKAVR